MGDVAQTARLDCKPADNEYFIKTDDDHEDFVGCVSIPDSLQAGSRRYATDITSAPQSMTSGEFLA
jgi:hypothetical protein